MEQLGVFSCSQFRCEIFHGRNFAVVLGLFRCDHMYKFRLEILDAGMEIAKDSIESQSPFALPKMTALIAAKKYEATHV